MADNEHRVLKSNTFDEWRQSTNEVSFDVGDDALLDNTRLGDKVFSYTASAGQNQFSGNNLVIQKLPDATIDNTGGYIILAHGTTVPASYVNGATISQGSDYSATIESVVTLDNKSRILVKNSTGTFSAATNLTVGSDTIANANIERIVSESFPKGNVRVTKGGTELVQGLTEAGFHIPNHRGTITLANSPSVDELTEGITIYQASSNQTTQEGVEANSTWWATVYHANTSSIKTKNNNGTLSTTSEIKVLGYTPSEFKVDSANVSSISLNDNTLLHTVELNNEAASGNAVVVITTDLVSAVNELQDDIGTVESLTQASADLVTAINDHESDIGNMTLTGLSATDLSEAARELRTELGDVTTINSATGYSASNASAGIVEIQGDIGDVTDLTTSHKATLVGAIGEIEAVFDASTKEISAGSNDFTINSNRLSIDANENIILDTNGGVIELKDNGTEWGKITNGSGQMQLRSGSNSHIFLTGNGVDATFNNDLTIERDLDVDRNLNVDGLAVIDSTLSVGALATLHSLSVTNDGAVGGNLDVTGTGSIGGDFDVNTNKFTVASASGNTVVAGTLGAGATTLASLGVTGTGSIGGDFDVNTNKFTVASATGNTVIGGTLSVGSLSTSAQTVRLAINELQTEIGSAVFTGDITNGAGSVTSAIGLIEAEIGDDEAYDAGAITFGASTISGTLVNLNNELDALNALTLTAGAGLSGGGTLASDRSFAVNVDDSSIEINSDTLRVKALGITNAMLAGSINQSKLAGSIPNSKLSNSTITISAEEGTNHAIALGETLTVSAGEGITTNITNNTLTISGELASETNAGIATFDGTDFTVTSGDVTINDERIEDIVGAMVSGNSEDGIVVSYVDNGTNAGKLNFDIDDASVARLTGSDQTFNKNLNLTNGNTLTIPSGATLDVSSGTLLLPGTSSGVSTFGSAFIRTDDNSAAQQGFAVKNNNVHSGYSHDPKIQWNHSQVASNPRRAWQAVGLAGDGTSSETADLVTFENARDLIASNSEAGINVTWDDTNNNFDFNVNDPTLTFTGDATGSGTITNLNNTSIALTISTDAVENSMILNDSITIGNSTIALGGTDTTLTGLTDIDLTSGNKTIFDGVGANTLTLGASSTTVKTAGDLSVAGDATITGDLTVEGTTTTINTQNLDIEDATVRFAKNATTLAATDDAGIEFGASSSKPTILWDNDSTRLTTNKRFHSSVGFTGSLTGNADTATALATARNFIIGSTNHSFNGTANVNLTEAIQDAVGAMFSGNTETGISVTYQDGDGTIDLAVGTLNQNTTGSAASLTTPRNFSITGDITANNVSFNGTGNVVLNASIDANTVGVNELNVSEGNNGEVLTTNGSGTLSFTAVSTSDTFVSGGSLSGGTLTLNRTEGASDITISGFVQSSDLPTVNNGQIDGRTSGLGLSGSMDATANQSGNTTFTVTSNATKSPSADTIAYRGTEGGLRATHFAATSSTGSILFDGDPGDNFNDHDPVPLKRIVCNDGGGNFNIRSGSYYDGGDKYAADGGGAADIIFTSDSGAGEITFRTAPVGTNAGDVITYANELELSTGSFKLKDGTTAVFTVDLDASAGGHHVVADGNITADKFVKDGGTSSQFLKADGSVDSNSYVTSSGVTSVGGTSPIASSGGTSPTISINLDTLPDMTQAWVNGTDEFIVLDNGVQKKKLSSEIFGSNAFNSTTIPAAANNSTITIGAGNAIDVSTDNTFTLNQSGNQTINVNVDLSEVSDMTQAWTASDEFIVLDNSVSTVGNRQKRKVASEIPVGYFDNDDGSGNTAYNNYIHPTFTQRSINLDTSGAQVIDTFTFTSNNEGHVTNATISTRDLEKSDIGLGSVVDGAEVNQNAFAKIQSQNGGTNETLHDSDAKRDTFTINAGTNLTIADGTDKITINNDITQVYNRVRALNSSGGTKFTETANSITGILKLKEGSNVTISDGGDDIFEISSTNTTYSAGNGISLSGTTFSVAGGTGLTASASGLDINSDQRGSIHQIGFGNSDYIRFNDDGDDVQLDFFLDGTQAARLTHNGKLNVKNDVVAFTSSFSDKNLKENIQVVEGALEKVSQLEGVTFDWKDKSKGTSAGVIAQNLEEVLPSAVNNEEDMNGDEFKAVQYHQLSALFIEAIKELKEENKLLKAEIESLKHINKGIE